MSTESPLLCTLPMAGRRHLLCIHTDNRQHETILAADEAQMAAMARSAWAKRIDARLVDALEIEMVAPSRRMQDLAERYHRAEQVIGFHHEVAERMREVLDAGLPVPPPFARCDRYVPGPDHEGDEEAEREHWWCTACRNGVRLVGMTPDDLYDAWHVRWATAFPPDPAPKTAPRRYPSEAEPAKDDEPIWCARAEFGHHEPGVVLERVVLREPSTPGQGSDDWPLVPPALTSTVLFLFRRLRKIDLDPLRAEHEAWKRDRYAEAASEHEAEKVERKQQMRQSAEEIIAFFTGGQ